MKKEMLINVRQSEECRIAIIEDGVLEELYVDRTSHETYSGNIYKGRIVNLEPAIQAAFVDFSIGRNGFLHVSDVEPRYYSKHLGDDVQLGGRDRGRDPRRVLPGDSRSGSPAGPADLSAGDRPSRPDRGPRRTRDDRRGGRPSGGRDIAAEPRSFDSAVPQAGSTDFDFPEDFVSEQVVDISANEMTTRRGPRPDGRRDRSRRGPNRSRSGRGNRERSPQSAESFPDASSEFPDDLSFEAPDFASAEPFAPVSEIVTESPAVLSERETPVESPRTPRAVSAPAPEPEPPTALAPAWEPPPVPPPKPSFVTRVRRAFGSGLEDWETPESPQASKIRQVLSPIPAPVPVAAPPAQPEPVITPPEPESRTVTRSMAPAAPDWPIAPPPQSPPPPRSPKRRGFGSGLIEEFEQPEESVAPRAAEQPPQTSPTFEEPLRPESRSTVQRFASFETESESVEVRSDLAEADHESGSLFSSPESAEVWSEFSAGESAIESFEGDPATEQQSQPRNRGRRRSGSSGRGRSRSRRGPDESNEEREFPAEAENLDPRDFPEEIDVTRSVEADFEDSPGIDPRLPRGRDAIRARGGNRQSRGPRQRPISRSVEVEPELPEQAPAPASPARGPSRYVPRLERERHRTSSVPGDLEEGEVSPVEFADSEFDTGFGGSGQNAPQADSESETPFGDDPRVNPRGRDGRTRRRRRRRRPGGEGEPRPESAGAETAASVERSEESDSWNELDWSGSPPGAAEALSGIQPDFEAETEAPSEGFRPRGRQRKRGRRPQPGPEVGPAPGDSMDVDSDDEFLEPSGRSYTVDPDDIVEPEMEEEIRREAEEIAALEIELGIRQPGEIRESPRSGGAQTSRSAAGGRGFFKPPIQDVFRRNDEVLVQVIKESLGTKGPTLSTYISIPGRYLVLMPGLNRVGVSRKIADDSQRRKLRDLMNQLNPPKGLGFIVRTAGVDRSKRELARDLAYLLRLWKTILRRIKRTKSPAPIYQESDMIIRTIRDIFNSEIDTIWIDEASAFERAHEFLNNVMPKFADRLKLYEEKTPLFHKYGIEDEIAKIGMRHVPLPDGGSIVIDQTEALVAIDVNSGNFRVEDDAERTAYEMNLRAAKEIARQLRLRDLGGVIVNDFIDMREERHRRGVERALRDAIRRDRARTKILRMSQFGLIEMTRQRIRPSIKRSIYEDCPHCIGQGVVKTPESMSIDVMRILALAANRNDLRRINITCSHYVANYLNNRKRQELARLEKDGQMSIHIRPEDHVPAEFLQIDGLGNYNTEFRLYPTAAMTSNRRLPNTTGNAPALPYNPQNVGGHHGHFH